jgi:hypothetical protein
MADCLWGGDIVWAGFEEDFGELEPVVGEGV